MENGEKGTLKKKNKDESGYSEVQSDQGLELQAGQWLDLSSTKAKAQQSPTILPKDDSTHHKKLVQAQQQTWDTLSEKLQLFNQFLEKGEDGGSVLVEILELQSTLAGILKARKWEQKGELDISKLSKQVQNLLK